MSVKRMRVFAGPNGSGKTTIFKAILKAAKVPLGVYVNADEIELALAVNGKLNFNSYNVSITQDNLVAFFKHNAFSPDKRNESDLFKHLEVSNNILKVHTKIDSYMAADIAEYIRQTLLNVGASFTYETVMSHPGKIDFLAKARELGYRVYLYYIATDDPAININRVQNRVHLDGHAVPEAVVRSRYYKSLGNLKNAVRHTSRAYIFDNSGESALLIAEITEGDIVHMNTAVDTPPWVADFLLNP